MPSNCSENITTSRESGLTPIRPGTIPRGSSYRTQHRTEVTTIQPFSHRASIAAGLRRLDARTGLTLQFKSQLAVAIHGSHGKRIGKPQTDPGKQAAAPPGE